MPYALLKPLGNVPPNLGWRANFYRVDHDDRMPTSWDWARVGAFQKFGRLVHQ